MRNVRLDFLTQLPTKMGPWGLFHLANFPKETLCTLNGDNSNDMDDHDSNICAVIVDLSRKTRKFFSKSSHFYLVK